jgi:hypothetical protein
MIGSPAAVSTPKSGDALPAALVSPGYPGRSELIQVAPPFFET